jgi:hypothetical protein
MRAPIPIRVVYRRIQQRSTILLLIILLLVLGVAQYHARAAVTLVYFRGSSTPNGVFLEWETASELDNLGFYVYRSTSQNGNYVQVSEFIPTSGDPLLGGYYQFTDTDVVDGSTYWYKLETLDVQSIPEMLEPPISVVVDTLRTATPTATSTTPAAGAQTSTVTPTRTANNRTATVTATRRARNQTPTPIPNNPYPAAQAGSVNQQPAQQAPLPTAANQEQQPSGVLTETLSIPISGTATLIPLPEITMEFPVMAVSNPPIPTPPTMPQASVSDMLQWVTPTRVLVILFILFVWLFLGGWFYTSMRRME